KRLSPAGRGGTRLRYSKHPNPGKRRSRLTPKSAWIEQPGPDLRIVDEALWQRVRERQRAVRRDTRPDTRQPAPFWAGRRARYLFSGLIKCGACGGNYVVISKHLYGCARARDRGTCANLHNIRRDVLQATVLDGLKSRLMDGTARSRQSRAARLSQRGKSAALPASAASFQSPW